MLPSTISRLTLVLYAGRFLSFKLLSLARVGGCQVHDFICHGIPNCGLLLYTVRIRCWFTPDLCKKQSFGTLTDLLFLIRTSRTCSDLQITWEDNSRRQHDDTDVQFVIYCCSVCYLLIDTFLGVRVELINSEYVWSMIGLLGFLLRDLHMPCRIKPN